MSLRRIVIMTVVLIGAYSSPMFGQTPGVDILNNSRNALLDLARNAAWGAGGRGSVNNAYIFTPVNPTEGFCAAVRNNNPTNSHTFTISAASTPDQQVTSYLGNISAWASGAVQASSVGNASTQFFYFRVAGASRVVVSITASTTAAGSPDTADIVIAQSTALNPGQPSCSGAPLNVPDQTASVFLNGNTTAAGLYKVDYAYDCPNTLAWGGTGTDFQLSLAVVPNLRIFNLCHLSFSSSAAADFSITTGTGTTCLTGTSTILGPYKNVVTFIEDWRNYQEPSQIGGLVNVCIHFSASVTVGGFVAYAIFP